LSKGRDPLRQVAIDVTLLALNVALLAGRKWVIVRGLSVS